MINKKLFLLVILSIFLINIISSQQVSYCCERTINEAWCQNAPKEQCDIGNNCGTSTNPSVCRSVPTSCEATSYCKLGTCINSKEGDCMINTPQIVCDKNGGVWNEKDKSQIPQCQLGCCLIGEQAAFVTQTRCKKLSSEYGLEIDYRADIQNERECISSAMPEVKGACVFEKEYERACKLLTKKECQEMQSNNTEFYEGFLCSAESLNTICGPRGGTTCVEGKDEVYFLDTCGNLANVYDYSKLDTPSYWETITASDCGDGTGNKGSASCGDCDYYSGSTCKKGNADYGNFVCKNLKCTYQGQEYQHGETWCATDKEDKKINSPGGKNFRLVCYNEEVSVEPCAEFRQEICIQSAIGDFKTAACRVNKWQDCYSVDNQKDCENLDKRDCKWIKGFSILKNETGKSLAVSETGNVADASCIPKYAPGFDFWENDSDATSMCSLANDVCVVEFYSGVGEGAAVGLITGQTVAWRAGGDVKCLQECRKTCPDDPFHVCDIKCRTECLPKSCVDINGNLKESWKNNLKDVCTSLGDCGSKKNYVGKEGYLNWEKSFVREGKIADKEGGSSVFDMIGGMFGGLFGGGK